LTKKAAKVAQLENDISRSKQKFGNVFRKPLPVVQLKNDLTQKTAPRRSTQKRLNSENRSPSLNLKTQLLINDLTEKRAKVAQLENDLTT